MTVSSPVARLPAGPRSQAAHLAKAAKILFRHSARINCAESASGVMRMKHSSLGGFSGVIGEIGAIYEAAMEGNFADTLLDMLSFKLPDAVVLLLGQDTVEPSGNYIFQRGLSPRTEAHYSVDLATRNPWFQAEWQQPVGQVFHDDQILDRENFRATGFYADWLSEAGRLDCATGVVATDLFEDNVKARRNLSSRCVIPRRMTARCGPWPRTV